MAWLLGNICFCVFLHPVCLSCRGRLGISGSWVPRWIPTLDFWQLYGWPPLGKISETPEFFTIWTMQGAKSFLHSVFKCLPSSYTNTNTNFGIFSMKIFCLCVRADRLYSCFKFPYWSEAVRQYRQCLEEASWQNQGWSYGAATCHGRAQLLRNKLQCFAMYTTQSCCEIICIALTQGTKVPLPTPSYRFGIFLASQKGLLECEWMPLLLQNSVNGIYGVLYVLQWVSALLQDQGSWSTTGGERRE